MPTVLFKGTILCTVMATAIISGCSSDDDDDTSMEVVDNGSEMTGADDGSTSVAGLVSIDSARPVGEAIGALRTALGNNEAIIVLPVIDHQANAASIDQVLRPTSVQLFGNPALGTPLMQVNQLAGIDLPQKILAWENEAGVTQLAYNSADYLQQRHLITGSETADNALEMISGALSNFSFTASGNTEEEEGVDTGSDTEQAPIVTASAGEGLVLVTSEQDMDTTYNALITAINNAAPLTLIAEVNHTANAESIGETLDPTRLVIFGNPNLGTPLLQAEQTIGIDLPQKMLVYENADGVVTIAYNDPTFLAARHGITGADDTLATISGALEGLANGAAGSSTE